MILVFTTVDFKQQKNTERPHVWRDDESPEPAHYGAKMNKTLIKVWHSQRFGHAIALRFSFQDWAVGLLEHASFEGSCASSIQVVGRSSTCQISAHHSTFGLSTRVESMVTESQNLVTLWTASVCKPNIESLLSVSHDTLIVQDFCSASKLQNGSGGA